VLHSHWGLRAAVWRGRNGCAAGRWARGGVEGAVEGAGSGRWSREVGSAHWGVNRRLRARGGVGRRCYLDTSQHIPSTGRPPGGTSKKEKCQPKVLWAGHAFKPLLCSQLSVLATSSPGAGGKQAGDGMTRPLLPGRVLAPLP